MAVAVGDRVKHPALHEQWGPGEVLATSPDGKVTVHFALVGQKVLKGLALEILSGDEARHPLLEQRKVPGKRAKATRPFSQLKEAFLKTLSGWLLRSGLPAAGARLQGGSRAVAEGQSE
jgi:hypothetical protein